MTCDTEWKRLPEFDSPGYEFKRLTCKVCGGIFFGMSVQSANQSPCPGPAQQASDAPAPAATAKDKAVR